MSHREAVCSWCSVPLDEEGLCAECFDRWPKCAVTACQNKSCLRLASKYCYPHTLGLPQDFASQTKETTNEPS
jgi:hypothetical protein